MIEAIKLLKEFWGTEPVEVGSSVSFNSQDSEVNMCIYVDPENLLPTNFHCSVVSSRGSNFDFDVPLSELTMEIKQSTTNEGDFLRIGLRELVIDFYLRDGNLRFCHVCSRAWAKGH